MQYKHFQYTVSYQKETYHTSQNAESKLYHFKHKLSFDTQFVVVTVSIMNFNFYNKHSIITILQVQFYLLRK